MFTKIKKASEDASFLRKIILVASFGYIEINHAPFLPSLGFRPDDRLQIGVSRFKGKFELLLRIHWVSEKPTDEFAYHTPFLLWCQYHWLIPRYEHILLFIFSKKYYLRYICQIYVVRSTFCISSAYIT